MASKMVGVSGSLLTGRVKLDWGGSMVLKVSLLGVEYCGITIARNLCLMVGGVGFTSALPTSLKTHLRLYFVDTLC